MAARRTDIPRDRATYERLYVDEGLSIRQIAAQLGVSAALVKKDLHRLRIQMRPCGLQKHVALDQRSADNYRALYVDQRLSEREIARRLGVSSDVVCKDMRRFGVSARNISAYVTSERERIGDDQRLPVPRIADQKCQHDRANARHTELDPTFFSKIDSAEKAHLDGRVGG